MLGRLRDFIHKKFIVKLPELDGARMVRGATKVPQDDPEHGYQEPVNLKAPPFVIKYNASDASSSLYTHKVGGLYELNPVVTLSLMKAPGFNPWNLKCDDILVFKNCFFKCNL
jgi:hypothetical protein